MKTLPRLGRFALVGSLGIPVQLIALALLNRWIPGHYLLASTAAIELAILHNFVWHLRLTWRDRRDEATRARQLLRFHLSNGLVSFAGNLALMRLLVEHAHLPVLLANILAIAACGAANFALADRWTFTARVATKSKLPSPMSVALMLFLSATLTHAQTQPAEPLPESPSSAQRTARPAPRPPRNDSYDSYVVRAGYMCGVGASTSSAATKPTIGCGLGFSFLPPLPVFTEIGIMAPQANRSYLSGYVSVDASIPLASTKLTCLPMAIVGYSRLFETGNAADYGLALAIPHHGKPGDYPTSLRLELRDYWTFANPAQHNIMLRLGWMSVEMD